MRSSLPGIPEAGLELGDALDGPTGKSAGAGFYCGSSQCPRGDAVPRCCRSGPGSRCHLATWPISSAAHHGLDEALVAVLSSCCHRRFVPIRARPSGAAARLLTEFDVEGVIGLPEGAFAPLTSIRTSLPPFRHSPRAARRCDSCRSRFASRSDRRVAALKNEEMVAQFRSGSGADTWDRTVEDLVRHDCELADADPATRS